MTMQPTIVLVHGALTDASIYTEVSNRLRESGYCTIAPAMPLRSLDTDAEYLAAFLDSISGPILLVGHSYGGSVISHPKVAKDNLKALVFVSAFIQDSGESAGELNARWQGSRLGEATTVTRAYPGGIDLYLRPEHFADVYANDLAPEQVHALASAQRPISVNALSESFNGVSTWKTVPSWAVITTDDRSIPPQAQREMAERANARVMEVHASHAVPLSQPEAVAQVIRQAAWNLQP